MAGENIIDILLERAKRRRRRYLEDPIEYARRIEEHVRRHDPRARILVFGSFARGEMKPERYRCSRHNGAGQ